MIACLCKLSPPNRDLGLITNTQLVMSLVLSVIMTLYLRRENARRDREYKHPDEYTAEEKWTEREKGDNATFFRYTV